METRKPETGPADRTKVWFAFAAVALALGLVLAAAAHRMSPPRVPHELQGVLWPEPRPLAPFSLMDQHRRTFDLSRLQGKWTFVFFGYTACPDVCPTTLQSLKAVSRELVREGANGAHAQFVFVSVDSERDRPESIGKYVAFFDKDFIGLTGTAGEIAGFARQLNVMYLQDEAGPGEGSLISHTSSVMLVDPRARLYAVFSRPHDGPGVVSAFRSLRKYYDAQS
jgi:protein SCO1/2